MFFGNVECFGMNLEYVIVKLKSENVQANNKMASPMNVATDNVTSQCFYAEARQIFR